MVNLNSYGLGAGSLAGISDVLSLLFSSTNVAIADYPTHCIGLTGQELLPNTRVISAVHIPKGTLVHLQSPLGTVNSDQVESFCRATLEIISDFTTQNKIKTEVWLPDNFNGRILGIGNGGFASTPAYASMAHDGVDLGFATFGTNSGHESGVIDASWGLNDNNAIHDFIHRSIHLSLKGSESLVGLYYKAKNVRRYYTGCSTGGGQGLASAQKYPTDFDGILVGSPAARLTHLQAWALRQYRLNQRGQFTPEAWQFVHEKVLEQCDSLDGVQDGIIEDPRNCHFEPAQYINKGLTYEQATVLKDIFRDFYIEDRYWFSGNAYGGEIGGVLNPNAPIAFPIEMFRYFIFNDSTWDHTTFNDEMALEAEAIGVEIDTVEPDISAFASAGGKLMHYFGWADPQISAGDSLYYFNDVHETMARKGIDVRSFYQIYGVPGMGHCAGGDGPNGFGAQGQRGRGAPPYSPDSRHDMMRALVDWAENGRAPAHIVATKYNEDGSLNKTRKLCPYPQRQVFSGQDSNSEQSFECV